MYRPPPRTIAVATALLGTISLVTAALYFTTIPENPRGDGFAAGLIGLFVILYVVMGVLALVEAGLLILVNSLWDPAEWSRRLLTAGAVAGGLSIVLLVVPMLVAQVFEGLLPGLITTGSGIGLLLVPIGIICSGLGAVVHLVDGFRTETRT